MTESAWSGGKAVDAMLSNGITSKSELNGGHVPRVKLARHTRKFRAKRKKSNSNLPTFTTRSGCNRQGVGTGGAKGETTRQRYRGVMFLLFSMGVCLCWEGLRRIIWKHVHRCLCMRATLYIPSMRSLVCPGVWKNHPRSKRCFFTTTNLR